MLRSAEVRWFFPGPWADDVRRWFVAGQKLDPESEREDQYLLFPDCDTVGVKLREGKLEVKAKVSGPIPIFLANGASGRTDQWVKWSFAGECLQALTGDLLRSGRWIGVQKERLLRKYSADSGGLKEVPPKLRPFPASGCNVELTAIRVKADRDSLFSLGFEAFGDPAAVAAILDQAVRSFLAATGEKPGTKLSESGSLSYPEWLATLVYTSGKVTGSPGA